MEKVLLFFTASALCAAASLAARQYHFIYEKKTWADAQTYCRQTHTDLATVGSLDVATTLNNMVNLTQMGRDTDAWIGLYEDVQSWRWSLVNDPFYQGYSTQYRNWIPGQPDNRGSNEPCSEMNDLGQWNDLPCEAMRKPLCMSVSSAQSASFVAVNSLMTWSQAQSHCRTNYKDLASVRTSAENSNLLAAKPSGESYWLGLYRDTWKWSNGDGRTFSYWTSGQPDGATEHCTTAYFNDAGRWRDWLCSYAKPFICHYDPVPFTKHVMKVKLSSSTVDLNDAAVQTDLLNQLRRKLQDDGLTGNLSLSWRRIGGKIFYTEQEV
ncbi:macrophage mannose receptor 1-like [Poecilia reticulata]|uniref:macrophage mannose receptor 1-like n=1 Tax=Poecilia reticulata TaxID=8081 RepID=UPI0004A43810|nr:PREDICTED: macrophage mannose receptor 1-like [Poecilia reticulata]